MEDARRRGNGALLRGATAFATLEPCVARGRTPPCADLLSAAGIARVVYGAADPDPTFGGGAARLRAAGIETEAVGGAAGAAVEHSLRAYLHARRTGGSRG